MRTIMVLNSKGGSGKSTIATSIASYYASQGNRVVLADCDPQASSLQWLEARPAGRSQITGIDGSAGSFRVPRSADYVVYDTPAAVHGAALAGFLRRAQSIIIPVLPSPIDMRAATPFIQRVLDNGRIARKEARVALVANRCREHSSACCAKPRITCAPRTVGSASSSSHPIRCAGISISGNRSSAG